MPATLLLVFLALVGGTVLWLHLASPARDGTAHDAPAGPQVTQPITAAPPPQQEAASPHKPDAPGEPAPPHEAAAPHAAAPSQEAPVQEAPVQEAPAQPAPTPSGQGQHEAAAEPADAPPPPPPPPSEQAEAPPAAPPQLRLSPAKTGPALAPAPDPALVEQSADGPLPRAGLDGRESWRVYARPFDAADKRPRIAIVVHGLGISDTVTSAAITGLPGAISLGFSPYADGVSGWMRQARAAGHETLMLLPMEPLNYPVSDPGPQALMTTLSPEQNLARLHWQLSRATGYVGVATYMGSRFASSRRLLRATLEELKKRGLLLLDAAQGSRSALADLAGQQALPLVSSALFIDRKLTAADIDARLEELETRARQTGRIVAMARPYPVTIERLAAWAAKVESRGFVLTPVSALAERARPS